MSIAIDEQLTYLKIRFHSDEEWYAKIMAHTLMNWLQEGKISQSTFERLQEHLSSYLLKTLL